MRTLSMHNIAEASTFSATRAALAMRWTTAAIVVALVSWSAMQTVAPSFGNSAPQFTALRVTPYPAATADQRDDKLWIRGVVVDGRLVRPDTGSNGSGWRGVASNVSGMPALSEYIDTAGSATMVLPSGPTAVVLSAWAWQGTLDLLANTHVVQRVALDTLRDVSVVGTERRSVATFIVAVILMVTIGRMLGAVRRGRRLGWLVIVLTAMHALVWVSQPIGVTNDSPGYLDSFNTLINDGLPSYFPPGYPLLVGFAQTLGGGATGLIIAAIQHMMAIAAGAWAYALMRRTVADEFAWVTGALAGGLPAVLTMSQTLMSEIVAMFAMLGAVYFAVRARDHGKVHLAIASGVLLGWAILSRVVPLAAVVPALLLIHLVPWHTRSVRPLLISLSSAAGLVLIPLVVFTVNAGRPQLTTSAGAHVFNRVVTEQRQLDTTAPATRRLVRMMRGDDPRGIAWWDVYAHPGVRHLDGVEFDRLAMGVALEGIRMDPWAYARLTPSIAWREFTDDPSSWIERWGEAYRVLPQFENQPIGSVTATSMRWRITLEHAHATIWSVLCWMALGAALVAIAWRQTLLVALVWVPFAYLYASASVDYYTPRHNIPIIPFVASVAMFLLALVIESVVRSASQWRIVHVDRLLPPP